MNPLVIWQYIGIFSTALAVVLLVLFLWRRRELRRYEAIEVGGELQEWGLGIFAKLLLAYAVGNYLGKDSVTRTTREIIETIKGEGLPATLTKLFWKLLEHFLKSPEKREEIGKRLAAAQAVASPSVVSTVASTAAKIVS